jgi:two-component system sensor histidine kinase MprB
MTLRARLTLAVALIVAGAVVAGGFAAHYSTRNALRAEADKFLLARAQRATDRPGPPDRGGFGDRGPGPGPDRPPIAEPDAVTQQLDASGQPTGATPTTDTTVLPVAQVDAAIARGERSGNGPLLRDVHVAGVHYRMLTAPLPGGGAIQIARSLAESDDVLGVLTRRLLVIVLAGTALAALVGWALARRTARPIETLTGAAEHIAATQELATPIPVKGDDEVGRLATAFNRMLDALGTSRRQQARLVADASHELRTPLTAVRTNIEFLERADLPKPERQALLAETRQELAELTTLVTELVELATNARADEPESDVDLASVAEDVAARFRRRRGRVVNVELDDPAVVRGRRSALERAVSNLVDNALKFSDAPAPVDIAVHGTRIEVADRGPGIDPADRARVFDRFYRADSARTRPGSGLGLSIVAQIAEAHRARASMEERAGGGTVARLDLPGTAVKGDAATS